MYGKVILLFLLLVSPLDDLNRIARVNKHKRAAKEAYEKKDFQQAAHHYAILVDSLGVAEEEVKINFANSLYHTQDTTIARDMYRDVVMSEASAEGRSQAHQQLGLMDYEGQHYEEALNHFKQSIRADPTNEDARYNYELLKKLIEEQEEQQQNQQNQQDENQEKQENQEQQDQQNQEQQQENQENQQDQQDQQNQENQDQQQQQEEGEEQEQEQNEKQSDEQKEGEQKEEREQNQPSTADKLEEMNISEEKAKMILEAMKNNEIQYIQQNKRKAKNKKKSGKPDW